MARRVEFYLGAATLAALVAATALAYYQPFDRDPDLRNNPFLLNARVENNRLLVDWDPKHPALEGAQRATLRVQEGGTEKAYNVQLEVLQDGGLDYLQSTPEALLSLTIHHPGRPDLTAYVRRVTAPEPPRPAVEQPATPSSRTASRTRRGRRR